MQAGREVPVALATEEALNALQGSNEDLQAQIDELSVLAKRLHGNQAAVINDAIAGSGTVAGTPGGFVVTMLFCDASIAMGICDESTGFVLQTGLIGKSAQGSIITFDASNSTNFPAIADLVTNGQNDVIKIETTYFKGDGNLGGGVAITRPDSGYFFSDTQTTTPGRNPTISRLRLLKATTGCVYDRLSTRSGHSFRCSRSTLLGSQHRYG